MTSTLPSLSSLFPPSALAADTLPCHDAEAADLFFSERPPADLEQAKSLCSGCPLIDECRNGALDRAEPWGASGGAGGPSSTAVASCRQAWPGGPSPQERGGLR